MKKVSISELRNQLSACLQNVRRGETVVVHDRSRPVARIDRVADEDDQDRVAELQRSGQLAPPVDPLPLDRLRSPAPRSIESVLHALLEERQAGR
jgi:prevent-host-death family protein